MATRLFVCTHVDFKKQVKNPIYKVMDIRKLKYSLPVDTKFYSELATYKYIVDKMKLAKYVGFCQYRRYFEFMDDVPEMEEIFKGHNVVATIPMRFNVNTRAQYARSHNVEDLDLAVEIVKEHYPQYYDSLKKMLEGNSLYVGNMFVMKSMDFKECINYVFGVLDKWLEKVGTDIEGHIEENWAKYDKNKMPNSSKVYQFRIGGYIGERLVSAFIMQLGKVKEYKMNVTSERLWNL